MINGDISGFSTGKKLLMTSITIAMIVRITTAKQHRMTKNCIQFIDESSDSFILGETRRSDSGV